MSIVGACILFKEEDVRTIQINVRKLVVHAFKSFAREDSSSIQKQ